MFNNAGYFRHISSLKSSVPYQSHPIIIFNSDQRVTKGAFFLRQRKPPPYPGGMRRAGAQHDVHARTQFHGITTGMPCQSFFMGPALFEAAASAAHAARARPSPLPFSALPCKTNPTPRTNASAMKKSASSSCAYPSRSSCSRHPTFLTSPLTALPGQGPFMRGRNVPTSKSNGKCTGISLFLSYFQEKYAALRALPWLCSPRQPLFFESRISNDVAAW